MYSSFADWLFHPYTLLYFFRCFKLAW